MASATASQLDLRATLPLETMMQILLIYNHIAIQEYQTAIVQSSNLITIQLLSVNQLWPSILISFCMIPYFELDINHKEDLKVSHI